MNNFDYDESDYIMDDGQIDNYSTPIISKKPEIKSKSVFKEQDQLYDESEYVTENKEEHPYFGQYAHLTPSEYENLSPEKKKELQEYSPLKGIAKGFVKAAQLGYTELTPLIGLLKGTGLIDDKAIPNLQTQEHETGTGLGEFLGIAVPISLTQMAMSIPFQMIGFMDYTLGRIASSAATGAVYSLEKQAVQNKGIEVGKVAEEAAEFAAFHGLIEGLMKIPALSNWVKSLLPNQRNKLAQGMIPDGLTDRQWTIYQDEVVPELQKIGRQRYSQEMEEAIAVNEKEFEQTIANETAKHENKLYKQMQERELSEQEFDQAKTEHQNKIKQLAAEYEEKSAQIQKQNEIAMDQFERDNKAFETLKARQDAVKNAIRQPESHTQTDLEGRISKIAPDSGVRPGPDAIKNPTVRNRIGSIFSPDIVTNESKQGMNITQGIRANDAIDYDNVNKAYDRSRALNQEITVIQPNLTQDLIGERNRLMQVPKLSPPEEQKLSVINEILQKIAVFNENGNISTFIPINNNILEEQAKALRYFMDFNFQHGNTKGIFSPLVQQIEDAIELGANFVGNIEAAQANKTARTLYRQWAEDYNNDYIRPFRDTTNQSYIKLFEKTLDPDVYPVVNNILMRSQAGQEISSQIRRSLVEEHLKPFFDNPRTIDPQKLEDAFKKIREVVTPSEERLIKNEFSKERRRPVIEGKKTKKVEKPEVPQPKELQNAKIPAFTKQKRPIKEITEISIPKKPTVKETPSMKAASKLMEISPEQAIKKSNSISGLREMKQDLPDALFKKIGKDKVREILYEGHVEKTFTGSELYEIVSKSNNYEMLNEILGEEAAAEMLVISKQLGKKEATVSTMRKLGIKATALKTLLLFGVL